MPKVLITSDCQVSYGDDRGGVHQDAGDIVTVSKEVALALVRASRALYVNKQDDPDKRGRDTATAEMLSAADAMQKAKRRAASKPAAPGGGVAAPAGVGGGSDPASGD